MSPKPDLVQSAYWGLHRPRLQGVYRLIAAFFGVGVLFASFFLFDRSVPTPVAVLALAWTALPLAAWLGLAWFAGRKPRLSVYLGIVFFVVLDVLPSLLAPGGLLGLLRKGITLLGLIFAWRLSGDLEEHPRWVDDE